MVCAMRARALVPAIVAALLLPGAAAAKPRPLLLRWLHMVDGAHGYAISGVDTRSYRLLRTGDGGRHWTDITPGKGTIHPTGAATVVGRTILFATQRGPQTFAVERSDDGGRTWRMSAAFRDTHPAGIGAPIVVDAMHLFVAVGEGAAAGSEAESLWGSADGGRTWHFVSRTGFTVTRPGQLPFGCDKDGFGFATASRGWAGGFCPGGAPFLYRTVDGGRTWQRASLPGIRACECNVSPPIFFGRARGVIAVSGWAASGNRPLTRVYWTVDGGTTWRPSTPTSGRTGWAIGAPNARIAWLTATAPGSVRPFPVDRLVRTTDAGRHWQSVTLPFDAGAYQLDPLDATTAFAYGGRSVLTTTDGGVHWQGLRASPACALGEPKVVHGSRIALVPPGATSVVLCWYGGLNARGAAGRLLASARVTRNLVVRLTNELDALPKLPNGIHCPVDDGSAVVARFEYAHAAPSAVRIGLTGCDIASNGRLTRRATPAVTSQVERILQPNGLPGLRPSARCTPQQLGVDVKTQGENTTAWIGVTVQNRSAPCVAMRVPVTVAVPGSRLTLDLTATLAHGGTRLLVLDWSNWCGGRTRAHVVAYAGAAEAVVPVRPLPLCLRPGQPSRLSAVH